MPDIYQAIADPTRRRILRLLIKSGPVSITALAEEFYVTRQAITKHLVVLEQTGLIRPHRAGREKTFSVDLAPLKEIKEWIDAHEQLKELQAV